MPQQLRLTVKFHTKQFITEHCKTAYEKTENGCKSDGADRKSGGLGDCFRLSQRYLSGFQLLLG